MFRKFFSLIFSAGISLYASSDGRNSTFPHEPPIPTDRIYGNEILPDSDNETEAPQSSFQKLRQLGRRSIIENVNPAQNFQYDDGISPKFTEETENQKNSVHPTKRLSSHSPSEESLTVHDNTYCDNFLNDTNVEYKNHFQHLKRPHFISMATPHNLYLCIPQGPDCPEQWYKSKAIDDLIYNTIHNASAKSSNYNQIYQTSLFLFSHAKTGNCNSATDILCCWRDYTEIKEIALVYAILFDQEQFIDYIMQYGAKLDIFKELFLDVMHKSLEYENYKLAAKIIAAGEYDDIRIDSTKPNSINGIPKIQNVSVVQWFYNNDIDKLITYVIEEIEFNNQKSSRRIPEISKIYTTLLNCAKTGNIDAAISMISCWLGSTVMKELALVYAILYDQKNFIDYMMSYDAKLDIFKELFENVIYRALEMEDYALAAKIMDAGGCADIKDHPELFKPLIYYSVMNKNYALATKILEAGVWCDIEHYRDSFKPLIYYTLDVKNYLLAAQIIDAGGCVDITDNRVITALKNSAQKGDKTLAEAFFNAGTRRHYDPFKFSILLGEVQSRTDPKTAQIFGLFLKNWYKKNQLQLTFDTDWGEEYEENTQNTDPHPVHPYVTHQTQYNRTHHEKNEEKRVEA